MDRIAQDMDNLNLDAELFVPSPSFQGRDSGDLLSSGITRVAVG